MRPAAFYGAPCARSRAAGSSNAERSAHRDPPLPASVLPGCAISAGVGGLVRRMAGAASPAPCGPFARCFWDCAPQTHGRSTASSCWPPYFPPSRPAFSRFVRPESIASLPRSYAVHGSAAGPGAIAAAAPLCGSHRPRSRTRRAHSLGIGDQASRRSSPTPLVERHRSATVRRVSLSAATCGRPDGNPVADRLSDLPRPSSMPAAASLLCRTAGRLPVGGAAETTVALRREARPPPRNGLA